MLIPNLVYIELTLFLLGVLATYPNLWRFLLAFCETRNSDFPNVRPWLFKFHGLWWYSIRCFYKALLHSPDIFGLLFSFSSNKICCGLASQVKLTHPYVSDTQETCSWGLYWPSKKMMRKDKRNTLMVLMIGRRAVPAAGADTVDLSLEASLCQVNIILTEMVVEIIVKAVSKVIWVQYIYRFPLLNFFDCFPANRSRDMLDTESGLTSDTDFSLTDVSQLDVNSSHQMVCLYREYSLVCRTATSIIEI